MRESESAHQIYSDAVDSVCDDGRVTAGEVRKLVRDGVISREEGLELFGRAGHSVAVSDSTVLFDISESDECLSLFDLLEIPVA